MALTPAERNRRYRARLRGEPVPRGRPGRKRKDYFEANAWRQLRLPDGFHAELEAIDTVVRLLQDAKLQASAAEEAQSETRKIMEQLLAMVHKEAE